MDELHFRNGRDKELVALVNLGLFRIVGDYVELTEEGKSMLKLFDSHPKLGFQCLAENLRREYRDNSELYLS